MQRKIGVVLAWLAATAISILIATAAVGAVRGRVTDAPPAVAAPTTTVIDSTPTTDGSTSTTSTSSTSTTSASPDSSTSTTAQSGTTTTIVTATTQAVAESQIKTFTAIGGTVTIQVSSSQITLLGATPSNGFTVSERELSPTKIEIEFSSADHESKFRAELKDGVLDTEIDEGGDD